MTLEQAKENLLKEVKTPNGNMVLYGINLIPTSDAMGLIFYMTTGQKIMFFSID